MKEYEADQKNGKCRPAIQHGLHKGGPKYAGRYGRETGILTRQRDGLKLKWLQRPGIPTRPSLARQYLVDGSTGEYLSSLYDQGNGTWEFDDKCHRYRVQPEENGTWIIEALYRVGSGQKSRGNRHV